MTQVSLNTLWIALSYHQTPCEVTMLETLYFLSTHRFAREFMGKKQPDSEFSCSKTKETLSISYQERFIIKTCLRPSKVNIRDNS